MSEFCHNKSTTYITCKSLWQVITEKSVTQLGHYIDNNAMQIIISITMQIWWSC